jgi:DNA-binding IclR family transcriptional regulator
MSLIARTQSQAGHLAYRARFPADRRSMSRSATRALDVLELFGEARRELRAVEIASSLDISRSSANQLLKTMVDSAHLVFSARNKSYLPSPRLTAFGSWMTEIYGSAGPLHDLVATVRARTGMLITLTTPNDLMMQVIDLAGAEGQLTERGVRVPMFGTVTGSAYLASLDDAEVRRIAYRARIPESDLPAIQEALDQIRAVGLADGQHLNGSWTLAIKLPLAGVPCVLAVNGPATEVQPKVAHFSEILREAVAFHFPIEAPRDEVGEFGED